MPKPGPAPFSDSNLRLRAERDKTKLTLRSVRLDEAALSAIKKLTAALGNPLKPLDAPNESQLMRRSLAWYAEQVTGNEDAQRREYINVRKGQVLPTRRDQFRNLRNAQVDSK